MPGATPGLRVDRVAVRHAMKLLFLCHRLPYPPKRGGKIRPFNMIRHLSRNHDVTVATLARNQAERLEGQELRNYCRELLVGLIPAWAAWSRFGVHGFTRYPSTFAYFHSRWLAREVRGRLHSDRFDAIVVHSSSMGPYVAHHQGCRKVMDFGDADSEKWSTYARTAPWPLSFGFRLESTKVRRYESWLGSRFDVGSVISEQERRALARLVSRPIVVIPNGVDLGYFSPRSSGPSRHAERPCLILTGNMAYRANVDAAKHLVADILPRIHGQRPDVRLYIVGMDPTLAVRRLSDGDRVVVTGRVEDVRPYFEQAAVAVAPLRMARGLQNKVLEAMAMGVPVVASPEAVGGIDAVSSRDLLVAQGSESFAGAVLRLLEDPQLSARYAAAGRAYVTEHHDWAQLLGRLEALVVGDLEPERRRDLQHRSPNQPNHPVAPAPRQLDGSVITADQTTESLAGAMESLADGRPAPGHREQPGVRGGGHRDT